MLKMRNNFRKDFGISYNKHLFIKIIDVQMTYNVVFNLFCTASDSDMHESILHFHFCEAHHRISNRAPCALQQDFVDYPSYLYWFASVNPKLPVATGSILIQLVNRILSIIEFITISPYPFIYLLLKCQNRHRKKQHCG